MKNYYSIPKKSLRIFFCLFTSIIFVQCASFFSPEPEFESIRLGNREFMSKNLDVSIFRNGDSIPYAPTHEDWQRAAEEKKPAWCYPIRKLEDGGKLYNYYAVADSRGLAPEGWRIPSYEDWSGLVATMIIDLKSPTEALDSEKRAEYRALVGRSLKAKAHWTDGGNGTNQSGFNALPVGDRMDSGPFVNSFGDCARYWSKKTESLEELNCFSLVFFDDFPEWDQYCEPGDGLSVRCIKE
jgi:uncharacterized protein (TIGR02145 family)